MNWLDFTTTLVNANVGITNDNLEIYEDEIFNSILANYDEDTSVGVTITETILLSNGVLFNYLHYLLQLVNMIHSPMI